MKKWLLILCLSVVGVSLNGVERTAEEKDELLSNKLFRPKEVALKKAVKVPVYSDGKKSGELTVPAGRVVALQNLQDQKIEMQVGSEKVTVPVADTDFLDRADVLKKEWDKKTPEEKRAHLIAQSPVAPKTADQPAASTAAVPEPLVKEETASAPAAPEPPDAPDDKNNAGGSKARLVRFLTSQPMRCVENGNEVAISNFRADGTYILQNGYVGKWKLDRDELVTYYSDGKKERINRYVYEPQYNKFAGKRDKKSDIQDKASLYMMPVVKK